MVLSFLDSLQVPENIPSKEQLWSNLGLTEIITEDTVVYVCLQTLFKLVPDFDAVFRQILERNPNARIIFKQFSTPELNDRLARRLKSSIGQLVDRITILTGGIDVGFFFFHIFSLLQGFFFKKK